jgi:hypothetical protein
MTIPWQELIIAVIVLAMVFAATRWAKLDNIRQGWDAHRMGLSYNPKWGKDVCAGWNRRADGLPRP